MNGGITMLVRFSVENYMSFKEPQVFSMAADKGTRHSTHVASAGSKRLLRVAFYSAQMRRENQILFML